MKFLPHPQYNNTWIATTRGERFTIVVNREDDGWAFSVTDHSGKCGYVEQRQLKARSRAETLARKTVENMQFGKFAHDPRS